ncbi:MAG: DNA internalization-related competence protein ComEC/Rec2 [Cocleimonas sp.]
MRLFSLFLLFGTLIIQWFAVIPSWKVVLITLGISVSISVTSLVFLKNRLKSIDTIFITICAFLFGLLLASYQASDLVTKRITTDSEGKELLITGKVKDIPTVRGDGVRFLLDVYSAEYVGTPKEKISLSGIVRLGWFQQAQTVRAGELWQLKVKLKRPSGFMNPGGFDYEKWLFTQKIIATGYVRKSKNIENQDQSENRNLNQTITAEIIWSVDHWRQKIHQTIHERVENKSSAAVLSALLVAVRDKLDDKQWQLLQATGTSHLVAISGLHIAVVAGFAFFPMMLLWRIFPRLNERIPLRIAGAVVGTLFAIAYAMLAGFTLPTQRALLMVMIGLWGLVSRRNYDASTILALALILVLLWDPLAAMTVSFWLSFLAIFLILFFIKRQIEKPRWMILKLQIFLSLAMLPLTLLFFGTASLTSPVANLFAIPWVSLLIVPISLLGLILMPISTFLSTQLLTLAAFLIDIFFRVLAVLGDSALSKLNLAEIPPSLLIIAFLGLLVLVLPKGFPGRWLGLLLMLPAISFQTAIPKAGEFTYTMLDVGQGYASVLHTQNHHLVYDAGTRVSESFDLGKLVVAPYLRSQGIDKIDTLMISHEDIDHRGGAQYLQENFEIDEVISSDTNALKESKACLQGQQWQWDGVNFEVLSPYKGFEGNDNNRSCVLKVWNQYHSLLLTGDIQKQSEKALLKSNPNKLKTDVLSVPHHGSKTSSTYAFIKQVSPKIGLISAGYRSRFGHPKPEVVSRYEQSGVELLDTVNYGAIILDFPDDNTEIKRAYYRLEKRGFWSR